jgi:hypothetical protein
MYESRRVVAVTIPFSVVIDSRGPECDVPADTGTTLGQETPMRRETTNSRNSEICACPMCDVAGTRVVS